MKLTGRRFFLAASLLGILGAGAPVYAQHSGAHAGGGGGGGHFGGGAPSGGGGGGHAAAGSPAGGSRAAFAGTHSFSGGVRGDYSGGASRFAAPRLGAYQGARGAGAGYNRSYAAVRSDARPGSYYGRGNYARAYANGPQWRGGYWEGGYWGGGFWPRAYYGYDFAWFLPILPLAYATYWYSGVPYYYANDVYYTYNPSYEGYVATDPPPVADSSGSASAPAADGGVASEVFMYPKNGQTAEQQGIDKADCQQWADQQAGQVAQNPSDYRRAMIACVEGRGYAAQ